MPEYNTEVKATIASAYSSTFVLTGIIVSHSKQLNKDLESHQEPTCQSKHSLERRNDCCPFNHLSVIMNLQYSEVKISSFLFVCFSWKKYWNIN